jgi:hypothetical protein
VRFIEYQKVPLDQQPGALGDVGAARAKPRMGAEQLDLSLMASKMRSAAGSLSLSKAMVRQMARNSSSARRV